MQEIFDLGRGRAAGLRRWLIRVATGVVQGVPWVLLLQSRVAEKVFVEKIATGFVGVQSGRKGAGVVREGG